MAISILKNVSIMINGVDLSTRADQIEVEDTADEVDVTAFQGNGYKAIAQGLKDATLTVTFFQDFASGSVHSVLNALYQSGAAFDVVFKGDSVATGVTNPTGTMSSRLFSYSPLSGSVGDASKIQAKFRNAGSGIAYATT